MEAVTAGPPEWRPATAPAASSTSFMITPPCTVPRRLVSFPVMMCESVVREAAVGLPGGASSEVRGWSVICLSLEPALCDRSVPV
jgi:hypothetical protein